jgi:hypothetical protein
MDNNVPLKKHKFEVSSKLSGGKEKEGLVGLKITEAFFAIHFPVQVLPGFIAASHHARILTNLSAVRGTK